MSAITKLTRRFTESVLDDEIVLMRLDNGELLSLAGTAAAVWRLIDGSRDGAALQTALAEEFAVEPEQVSSEVNGFLLQLRDMGLIAGC